MTTIDTATGECINPGCDEHSHPPPSHLESQTRSDMRIEYERSWESVSITMSKIQTELIEKGQYEEAMSMFSFLIAFIRRDPPPCMPCEEKTDDGLYFDQDQFNWYFDDKLSIDDMRDVKPKCAECGLSVRIAKMRKDTVSDPDEFWEHVNGLGGCGRRGGMGLNALKVKFMKTNEPPVKSSGGGNTSIFSGWFPWSSHEEGEDGLT